MKLFVSALLVFASSPTWAAADACANAVSDPEINACAEQELETADREMTAVYRKALSDLKDQGKKDPGAAKAREELILAQREWVKFRDHDCASVFHYNEGGSIRVAAELSCMQIRAKERTQQLKTIFDF